MPEMVAQASLGRFFPAVAARSGGEPTVSEARAGSPQTPVPVESQGNPQALTPQFKAAGGRKRGGREAPKSEAKRPRAARAQAVADQDQGSADPALETPPSALPAAELASECDTADASPMRDPAPQPGHNLDSEATPAAAFELAQRLDSRVPHFTACCLQHYASGGARYTWPQWLRPENLRDAQGRQPQEPGYDQGTLLVPSEKDQKDSGHGTPMLVQYWKLKAKHFDKIAFFKVGKFYELFYYDAFIAQSECGLNWMGEKKPHVGFPEFSKHHYAKTLVDAGFKVAVVEQVERVSEQKERGSSVGPACVERDTCEVFTKGTLVDPELLGGSGARYMAFLHFEAQVGAGAAAELSFGTCFVDAATSQIFVGRITDAPDRNALRTILAQVQPSEVSYTVENLPGVVLQILRRLPCRPLLSPIHVDKSAMAARSRLAKYRAAHPGKLTEAVEASLTAESVSIVAAGAMDYLESVLLGQRVLPFAAWQPLSGLCSTVHSDNLPASGLGSKRMVLDAAALSALEMTESLEGTYKGSILEYMDHTSTPSGFRLLKQWLCAPLCNVGEIQTRQDSVEFLLQNMDITQNLKDGLKKVPLDLERASSRVWGYALQAERHAVLYDDIAARRLADFMGVLKAYEQCVQLLATALPTPQSLPKRLVHITQTQGSGGCFPDLQAVITHLCGSVVDVPFFKNGKSKFCPADGADAQYDSACQQIQQVKAGLEAELQAIRSGHPGVNLAFVHRLPADRYEVECNHGALPQSFLASVDVTSKTQAKVRFMTPKIKDLVAQLDALDEKCDDCIYPFMAQLFQKFHAHQAQFQAAVRCLAELDAFLSLAVASQGLIGSSCRAELLELGSRDVPGTLELRGCRHPVAAARMGNSFVPNDALLNSGGVPGVLCVTGPNMGGKSTVLRQTCIAAVMAQLGCRVNADVCRLSPVDRIFTRIGSQDMILEGKSTLLMELEETATVLKHATPQSLAVLDELGRGTSTFDGAAIAAAVLDELSENVRCLVLFATHYHPVSREASCSPKVAPFHMAAEVDKATNEMTFLYRFLPGLCPASHGHNVARLAGLPAKLLDEARAKSEEFERLSETPALEAVVHLAQLGDVEGLKALYRRYCSGAGMATN